MTLQAVPFSEYLSLAAIQRLGVLGILWLILVAFLVLAARAKKIGTTSIGKNEWGMMEVLGFPLIPIPFGLWPYIKGVFHVKQVSTAPTRIELSSRREINQRVCWVVVTVFVRVAPKTEGSLWERFVQLRKNLIAALYGALDEDVDDAENPERIKQTTDILESATRTILKSARDTDAITEESLRALCGDDLEARFGEYIDRVFIREDAPVDGQLWKEGRQSLESDADDLLPAAPATNNVAQFPAPTTA